MQNQYIKENLKIIPMTRFKKPYGDGKWTTWTDDQMKAYAKKIDNIYYGPAIKCGYQYDGRYIIAVDFDIFNDDKSKSKMTKKHYKKLNRYFNGEGFYETSTCGNYACLVHVTNEDLINKLQKQQKWKVSEVEIFTSTLMGLPPLMTGCKKHLDENGERIIHKPRAFINGFKVLQSNKKFEKWIIKNIDFNGSKPSTKPSIKPSKQVPIPTMIDDDDADLELITDILNDLPQSLCDERESWIRIVWSCMYYSSSSGMYKLLKEWSKTSKKYTEYGFNQCWKNYKEGKITIGSLIQYHKTHSKTIREYHTLNCEKTIDLTDGMSHFLDEVVDFSEEYMTKKNGDIKIFKLDVESMKDKVLYVKSNTGSGKTTAIQTIVKFYNNHGYGVLSITPRRTLAQNHSHKLDINYYENTTSLNHGLAIQLDSLNKLDELHEKKYIVIMDEGNSLMVHLTNGMSHMRQRRTNIMSRLFDIINGSHFTFVVDADLSTSAIKLLKNVLPKKKHILYWNRYEYKDKVNVLVYDHFDVESIYTKIINHIKNDEPIFVCSDSFSTFDRDIVMRVKDCFKHDKAILKRIKFFSSEDGDKKEFQHCDWKKDFVFCTPTIIYGIDLNYEAHIYGIYYVNNTMDANNICQQLARVRKPLSMTLTFAKTNLIPKYFSLNEFIDGHKETAKELQGLNVNLTNIDVSVVAHYKTFVMETDYYRQRMMHPFHTMDILRRKGHTIDKVEKKANIEGRIKKEVRNEKRKEGIIVVITNKILDKETNEVVYQQIIVRYNILSLTFDIIDVYNGNIDDIDIPKEHKHIVIEGMENCLVDDQALRSFLNYRLFLAKDSEELLSHIKSHYADDIDYHVENSSKWKMYLIKKLMKDMNIDDPFTCDFKKLIRDADNNEKKSLTDYDDYKRTFELRNKDTGEFTDREKVIFLLDRMNTIFGNFMMPSITKIDGKKIYHKLFNPVGLKTVETMYLYTRHRVKKDEYQFV
jgi:hypothetical protein